MARSSFLLFGILAVVSCSPGVTNPNNNGNSNNNNGNNNPVVQDVALDHTSVDVTVGQTAQLSATVTDTKGNTLNRSVTWSSSAPNVGTGVDIPHFRAIYDLLRLPSDVPVPTRQSNDNPHGRCSYPFVKHGKFSILNDAFQCFPGGVTLT